MSYSEGSTLFILEPDDGSSQHSCMVHEELLVGEKKPCPGVLRRKRRSHQKHPYRCGPKSSVL
jgi:hypothetical protein